MGRSRLPTDLGREVYERCVRPRHKLLADEHAQETDQSDRGRRRRAHSQDGIQDTHQNAESQRNGAGLDHADTATHNLSRLATPTTAYCLPGISSIKVSMNFSSFTTIYEETIINPPVRPLLVLGAAFIAIGFFERRYAALKNRTARGRLVVDVGDSA
jgi:hypothetical protein